MKLKLPDLDGGVAVLTVYFRGAAPVMAADLAALPSTGIVSQICGDAHVSSKPGRIRGARWAAGF